MSFEGPNLGYTGHQFEEELLPEVDCDWDAQAWLRADQKSKTELFSKWRQDHLTDTDETEWLRARPEERKSLMLAWAKENQPENWDPSNPVRHKDVRGGSRAGEEVEPVVDNKIISNLHTFIAEKLIEEGVLDDYDKLKFYTTLDTPVDTLYGIDGFLEVNGLDFTLDLTVNEQKVQSGVGLEKADFVVTLRDPEDEQEIAALGQRIGQALKSRMEVEERRKKLTQPNPSPQAHQLNQARQSQQPRQSHRPGYRHRRAA